MYEVTNYFVLEKVSSIIILVLSVVAAPMSRVVWTDAEWMYTLCYVGYFLRNEII